MLINTWLKCEEISYYILQEFVIKHRLSYIVQSHMPGRWKDQIKSASVVSLYQKSSSGATGVAKDI